MKYLQTLSGRPHLFRPDPYTAVASAFRPTYKATVEKQLAS
jgi:hypothetical protein